MERVLTDHDFYDALEHLLSTNYPRIWDDLGSVEEDVLEQDIEDAFKLHGESFSDQEGKDEIREALEETSLSQEDVIGLIEREENFRQNPGQPSKVEYWATQIDDSDDVTHDLPWPHEDHEMAIRSSRTVSKLKRRLKE